MELKNDIELTNTRAKLADLEARYEELRRDTNEDSHVRETTMRSLMRYINQFKEEIARFECRRARRHEAENLVSAQRGIKCDTELENTRRKLRRLEKLLESKSDNGDDEELRRAERISLKRLINQFKEEISRYEAHQPAR